MFNLNHLAIFHAVAEELNVSRAAERLMVSQPAISKQLKEFEKRLGVPLFDRLARGVRCTESGALLATYARRIFSIVDDAEQAILELRGLGRGHLRIGASTTIGVYVLPEIFVRYRRDHPAIHLSLAIASSDALVLALLNDSIDIAFTEGTASDPGITSETIARDTLIAIAPPMHALVSKRKVAMETLLRQPFIVREPGSGTRSIVEQSLSQRGFAVKPVMSLGSTEAIKHAVAAGVGIAIVPHLAVKLDLAAGRLARIRVPHLNIERPVYRLTRQNVHPRASGLAFNAMFDKFIREKCPWAITVDPHK